MCNLQSSVSGRSRREWPALAAIAGVFVLGCAIVGPLRDAPVVDDWVYAWSVEHFLRTGQLRVLPITSIYPLFQILWGAMFARIGGFSFGVLRLSNVVLAALGPCGLYLTLRELRFSRSGSFLGSVALAVHPVYFALAFSFMTDTTFVSLSTFAVFWYVSAICRDRPARLWAGGLVAVVAFLVRPLAVAIPLAVLPALGWRRDWRSTVSRVVPIAATVCAMTLLWFALNRTMGSAEFAQQRVANLRWWFMVTPREYLGWNVTLAFIAAFPFAPLLLASLARGRAAVVTLALGAALFVALRLSIGSIPNPIPDFQTWSLQDIAGRAMIDGTLAPSAWSERVRWLVGLVGLVGVAALARGLFLLLRLARSTPAAIVPIAFGVINLALVNVLWFYNDRYYIVFAPLICCAAVASLNDRPGERWTAGVLLMVLCTVSVTGTRDMLDVAQACADARHRLEASGVAPSEIDAGYSNNGWRLYAHPENLGPGADREYDVPFVTSGASSTYEVSNAPVPGYEVFSVISLDHAWWQVSDRLYVLKRTSRLRVD